jgi:hypothetical protein
MEGAVVSPPILCANGRCQVTPGTRPFLLGAQRKNPSLDLSTSRLDAKKADDSAGSGSTARDRSTIGHKADKHPGRATNRVEGRRAEEQERAESDGGGPPP